MNHPLRGNTRDIQAVDGAGYIRKSSALRSTTAIILNEPLAYGVYDNPVHMFQDTIVISNTSSDYWRLRGHSINKIVLVGLTKAQLNPQLIEALEASTSSAAKQNGSPVPFIEV